MSIGGATLARLRRDEGGYSLVELITVVAILGTVMGALMTLFVRATTAERDMNQRFQAQQNAVVALQKLRREIHCASAASTTGDSVKLTLGTYCKTGSGDFTWCTASLGPTRWGLFRKAGATCDATGVKWADYLTAASVFTVSQPPNRRANVGVDFPIDVDPRKGQAAYRLRDAITLRNGTRAAP